MPTGLKHPPPRQSAATSIHDGVNGIVDCLEEEEATGGSGGGNNNNKNRCATIIGCSQRAENPGGNLLSIRLNAKAEDNIDERGGGRDDIIKDGERVIRRRS